MKQFGLSSAACLVFILASCSAGDPPPAVYTIPSKNAPPQLFGVDGVDATDLAGKAFPYYGNYAFSGEGDLISKAQPEVGRLEFLDDGTGRVVLDFLPSTRITFAPVAGSPGEYLSTGSLPLEARLVDIGYGFIFIATRDRTIPGEYEKFTGVFGFETPLADRPTIDADLTYSGFGALYIADNDQNILAASGTSQLTANFAANTIGGTLVAIDEIDVDIDGDGQFDDRLVIDLELINGAITDAGFTGQVGGGGDGYVNNAGVPTDLELEFGATGAQGVFLGNGAGAYGATFGGSVSINQPSVGRNDYSFSGVSDGSR